LSAGMGWHFDLGCILLGWFCSWNERCLRWGMVLANVSYSSEMVNSFGHLSLSLNISG
jgi:hypothetical protein